MIFYLFSVINQGKCISTATAYAAAIAERKTSSILHPASIPQDSLTEVSEGSCPLKCIFRKGTLSICLDGS